MKIAILGANGFIGGRAVEMLHLGTDHCIRPVVRSFSGLARLARFKLDWAIADARVESDLRPAFEGCEVVVHAVTGDARMIQETLTPVYRAAEACGVRRIIYLSTASVHGQAPLQGTDELTPLRTDHELSYNNAKVKAEWQLLRLCQQGKVEVVMLRPGIVFGPRSRWIAALANELLNGTAYLINGGTGICNSIYVDNVVRAIECAIAAPKGVNGEAFLIGDDERVNWLQLYSAVASGLGVSMETVHRVEPPQFRPGVGERLQSIRASRPVQALLPMVPRTAKRAVKAAILALKEPALQSGWSLPENRKPAVTQEIALLHHCAWRFPDLKARRVLGYAPVVSFAEGCRRSVQWLAFAGYEVHPEALEAAEHVQIRVASAFELAAQGAGASVGTRQQ